MLIVPTTFEPDLLQQLSAFPGSAIYGSLSAEPGGRANKSLPTAAEQDIEEHIAQARARGIGFFYTMNGSCGGNREFTAEGQKWLAERFGWLVDVGAAGVVGPRGVRLSRRAEKALDGSTR